ncbi:MAG TPA: hypothetical protein VFL27_16110 [Candidatus Dormibacteraeota bacterium]|nr:hypothetical protein [Candidatus Dormibacteraeota bacterium]
MSAKVERYGPGAEPSEFDPGDFILTHRHKPMAALISWGQRRRFKGADARFAHWSHAALIVAADGDLVEAEAMGVKRSPVRKYRAEEYHLVRLESQLSDEGRRAAVAYAEGQVGQAFGYLDLCGAALHLLFGWPLRWIRRNHEICSSLIVKALQRGGLLLELDPAITLPGDLAKAFDVEP